MNRGDLIDTQARAARGGGPCTPLVVGEPPWALATTDLDADGDADLAAVARGSGTVSILRNDGGAAWELGATLAAGNDPVDVAIADLNGDGLLDLVIADDGSDQVLVLLRTL